MYIYICNVSLLTRLYKSKQARYNGGSNSLLM